MSGKNQPSAFLFVLMLAVIVVETVVLGCVADKVRKTKRVSDCARFEANCQASANDCAKLREMAARGDIFINQAALDRFTAIEGRAK